MSPDSRTASSVSPLVWLTPLPFVLAMCLPVKPPAGPAPADRVATVAAEPAASLPAIR